MPVVRFTRERIEVAVRPGAIDVDGLYVYENPWPVPVVQGLKYPFPIDEAHPIPSSIEVSEVDPLSGQALRSIPVVWLGAAPRYSIRVPGRGSRHIRVRYTQSSGGRSGTYLLTTTRPWRQPLVRGEYVLLPKGGARILSSSYPLDGPEPGSFTKEGFMPDKEWEFTWAED